MPTIRLSNKETVTDRSSHVPISAKRFTGVTTPERFADKVLAFVRRSGWLRLGMPAPRRRAFGDVTQKGNEHLLVLAVIQPPPHFSDHVAEVEFAVADRDGRLVQDEGAQVVSSPDRLQHVEGTTGMAQQRHESINRIDDGRYVLGLTLQGTCGGVAARAAPRRSTA